MSVYCFQYIVSHSYILDILLFISSVLSFNAMRIIYIPGPLQTSMNKVPADHRERAQFISLSINRLLSIWTVLVYILTSVSLHILSNTVL